MNSTIYLESYSHMRRTAAGIRCIFSVTSFWTEAFCPRTTRAMEYENDMILYDRIRLSACIVYMDQVIRS